MTLYAPAADIWAKSVLPRVEHRPGPLATDCWIFTGCVNSRGYGCVVAGRKGKSVLVHRLAIAVRDGALPELPVDHLCMVKRCCNPDHLEVVTTDENNRRERASRGYCVGGRCGKGHELSGDNVTVSKRGRLICRTCVRGHAAKSRRRTSSSLAIREWLIEHGYPVKAKGRIPAELLAAYDAAHQAVAA